MQRAHAEKGLNCPLYKQDVSEVCHNCAFWAMITMLDPQDGTPINEWRCVINMLPGLMIEVARQTRHTNSEVHEFRNDTAKQSEAARTMLFGVKDENLKLINDVSHTNANRME